MTMGKALVLLSGGADSTTLIGYLKWIDPSADILALGFDYGQRHANNELSAFTAVVRHYGIPYQFMTIPPTILAGDNALTGVRTVAHGSYKELRAEAILNTEVPFRNGVLLAIAASRAMSWGYPDVAIAVHKGDHGLTYPYNDCKPAFIDHMNNAVREGTDNAVNIATPFINWTKRSIVEWGKKHGVPYEVTWSCYEGGDVPCGKCPTCIERKEAGL